MLYEREIEKKFIIENTTYEEAMHTLEGIADSLIERKAVSNDLYWKASGVDFIRLRENSRELTVKVTDKTSIVDRIEENVVIDRDSMDAAERGLTLLYGPPCLRLVKQFSVYSISYTPVPGTRYNAILCLYQVKGDPKERVFFEVEASTLRAVDAIIKHYNWSNLVPETKSLFQIFMGDK